MKFNHTLLSRFTLLAALLAAPLAHAQMPSFDNSNPSPSAGDSTSQQANAAADKTLYKDVNYTTLASDTVYFAFDSSVIPGAERGKLQQVPFEERRMHAGAPHGGGAVLDDFFFGFHRGTLR